MTGDLDGGRDLLNQALEMTQELGQRLKMAFGSLIAADIEMQVGDAAGAEELLRPAVETLIDVNDRTFLAESARSAERSAFCPGEA